MFQDFRRPISQRGAFGLAVRQYVPDGWDRQFFGFPGGVLGRSPVDIETFEG